MNNKVDADATGWAEKLKCLVNEHGSKYYTPEEIEIMVSFVEYMGRYEIDDERDGQIEEYDEDEIDDEDEDEDEIDDEEKGWAKGLKYLINEYGSQNFTLKEIDDMVEYIDYLNNSYDYYDKDDYDQDGNYIDTDGWEEELKGFIDEFRQYFTPKEIGWMEDFIDYDECGLFDMFVDVLSISKVSLKKSMFNRLQYYFPLLATPDRIDSMKDLEKRVIPD